MQSALDRASYLHASLNIVCLRKPQISLKDIREVFLSLRKTILIIALSHGKSMSITL